MNEAFTIYRSSRGRSPWTPGTRWRVIAWECCWTLFCRWTPKPLWGWRNGWLRVFGANVGRRVFVHQRARIKMPWNVRLRLCACIGDRANLYSLDVIDIGQYVTVAQEAYLCTGTHDFGDTAMPLATAPILIGEHAFIGARALVLPGVTIGHRAIVGAGAVITKHVLDGVICAGNPARVIGMTPSAIRGAAGPTGSSK